MEQKYSVTGAVYRILNPETRGRFTSRKLVLEIEGFKDRKEHICLEFSERNMDALDSVREGDTATVHFELRGRESQSKPGMFFTNLAAWRIEVERNGSGNSSTSAPRNYQQRKDPMASGQRDRGRFPTTGLTGDEPDSDDLPF